MLRNGLVYAAIVVVAAMLAFMSGSASVYSVLIGTLLVPVVSFGLTLAIWLPTARNLRFSGMLERDATMKGQTVVFNLTVENNTWLPFYRVRIAPYMNGCGVRTHVEGKQGLFTLPRESTTLAVSCTGIYRGQYTVGVRHLTVYEPFGLLGFRCAVRLSEALTVRPGLCSLDSNDGARLGIDPVMHGQPALFAGDPYDVAGLRAYRPSDSYRRVHWAVSARRNELISKEFAPQNHQAVLLLWDNHIVGQEKRALATDDVLAELVSSVASAHAETNKGFTEMVLAYGDNGHAVTITANDFETLYAAVSRVPRNGNVSLSDMPHRTPETPYETVYIFTATPTEALVAYAAACAADGGEPFVYIVCPNAVAQTHARGMAERLAQAGARCSIV